MAMVLTPVVAMNGAPMAATWLDALVEVKVEREFQVPSRATLRFADPGYTLISDSSVALGQMIQVSDPQNRLLITAEVTSVSAEQRDSEAPELVLMAHDKSHRLGRATNVTTYLQMTYSDVVQKLASSAGLLADTDSTSVQLEYLLQIDSDLGLISEMARRVGFDWWVDDTTLYFKKPAAGTSVPLRLHNDLRSFSVRASGHGPDTVEVFGWNRQQQTAVTSTASTPTEGLKADSTLANLVSSPGGAFGSATVMTAGVAAISQSEADQLSTALRDRAAACAVTARGVADGNGALKPGVPVQVSDAGPLSGSYPLTKVEHLYRPRTGFVTRFVAGDRHPTTLVDTLSGTGAAASPATRHPGLVVGQVTNINDPNKSGRVKVRYPGLSANDESAWARLVAIGGGKNRGSVFIPEVGDEVLVAFEAGDPRQPVVLGGLYGDKSTIPAWNVADGMVSSRGITSRLGHVVSLSDGTEESAQYISLQLAGQKHTLRVGKDQVNLEVPAGTPVNIKAGNTSIVFGQDGSITIQGATISIKATQSLAIQAPQVSIKADSQLSLESKAQAGLKGAMVSVDGSGLLGLKGGMVQIN